MIKAGDLVVAAYIDHACAMPYRNQLFTVQALQDIGVDCPRCGTKHLPDSKPSATLNSKLMNTVPLRWLRKVDPVPQEAETRTELATCKA